MSKLRILYISNFFTPYGGAENSIQLISNLMEQKGHEVFYYSTDKRPYFRQNYEYSKYFPKFFDKRSMSFKDLSGILATFYNKTAKNNLSEYLREIKPDVVSVHNVQFHLSYSVLDACKEYGVPVTLYIHDPRLFCPGGTLSYGESYCYDEPCVNGLPLPCLTRKCKEGSLKGSMLAALNQLYNRKLKIFDKVNAVVCPSAAIKSLAERGGVPENKLKVISHFLHSDKFNIVPGYENKGYFLYVGRVDREKGINTLIEAMQNMPEDIKLHIVGKGYDTERLKELVNELRLNNIIFRGYLSGEELDNEYRNCIATVLPCNWFEAFGRTILESFLWGKPVIASNLAAIPEIIEHDINGILFEPKNTDQLSKAMIELVNDWQKVKDMGQCARQKLEKYYNSEVYYEKYYALLGSLSLR